MNFAEFKFAIVLEECCMENSSRNAGSSAEGDRSNGEDQVFDSSAIFICLLFYFCINPRVLLLDTETEDK